MERYLEIATLLESATADRSCEVLERAGIPVLIRHTEIASGESLAPAFTLLVPLSHSNQAQNLVGPSYSLER